MRPSPKLDKAVDFLIELFNEREYIPFIEIAGRAELKGINRGVLRLAKEKLFLDTTILRLRGPVSSVWAKNSAFEKVKKQLYGPTK